MKKALILSLVLVLLLASVSLAAPVKKKVPAKKPAPVKKVLTPAPLKAPVTVPAAAGNRGFAAKGGLMGGAGVAELGYYLPTGPVTTGLYVGYGLGNKFNVMAAQLEAVKQVGGFNVGLSLDYANYSSAVRNIPGLAGDTAKGAHAGIGLTVGKEINNKMSAGLGYSTAFGLTATVGYKF
ncbi:MAG: hypothetical protein WC529_00300 [Candidatus Margulisiibacteriota bacterium]